MTKTTTNFPTEVNGYPVLKAAPDKDNGSDLVVVLCDCSKSPTRGAFVCWYVGFKGAAYLGVYGDKAAAMASFKQRAGKPYRVTYSSIDGCRMTRGFATLKGARKFATEYVGEFPEIGFGYAVAGDGVGKVTVRGCSLRDLFSAEHAA
jgi:hypothetical protein